MLPFLVLLPFVGALLLLLVPPSRRDATTSWMTSLFVAAGTLALLTVATFVDPGGERREFFLPWIPEIGLHIALWLDGPALFFSWLVCGIGFLVFLYAGFYMDPDDAPARFYSMMMLFMGSMLGVVMSRNAMLMLFFWELTSITSFMLIGHWHHKANARAGALRALTVTALGGLALLAGLAVVFWITSQSANFDHLTALNWDNLWAQRQEIVQHPLSTAALILILVGAFTKSAQFPFHFWLPGAMEAPTPVSAYLHAATMVKAGIYLLGRLYPVFGDHYLWLGLVGGTGVLTMCVGGWMAIMSNDLKQLLAHSTVSQLGLLTAYYGFGASRVGTETPLPLDLLLVASHALFKGGLFMIVGIIDHGAHTREWKRLGGLWHHMPVTAVLTIIGCASMAGIPLTTGFVAKELFLKAALKLQTEIGLLKYGLPAVAIFASVFTAAYCYRMAISPFFGKPRDPEIHAHEGGPGLLIAPAILIGISLLGGLYVPIVEAPLARFTSADFYGVSSSFTFGMFHHVDKLLWFGLFIFAAGFGVFLAGARIEDVYTRIGRPGPFAASYSAIFDHLVPMSGKALVKAVQSPSLRRNVTLTFLAFVVITAGAVYTVGLESWSRPVSSTLELHGMVPVVLSAVAVVLAIVHRVLVVRILAVSVVGLFVVLFFMYFKAPDLALTQLLVEIVTLIVLLVLMFRMPQTVEHEAGRTRERALVPRIVFSGAAALLVTLLAYFAYSSPLRSLSTYGGNYPTVTQYYLENTKYPPKILPADYPGADAPRSGGGYNAVNVTLVDFRAFDTLGEIAVLAIAAIGVVCLLMMGREKVDRSWRAAALARIEEIGRVLPAAKPILTLRTYPSPSLLTGELARIAPPFVIVVALALFLVGHNAPGGGFIAGLVTAVGFLLVILSFRSDQVSALNNRNFFALIPLGLAIATLTGLAAVWLGHPFLTSAFTYVPLPGRADVELASAAIFDLGVYLLVLGVTMVILQLLGKE